MLPENENAAAEEQLPQVPSGEINAGALNRIKKIRDFPVTLALAIANITLFIIMATRGVGILQPSVEDLLNWGGNLRASVLDGEWWRLMSCWFIHAGIIHLLMNMYALLVVGILLEPLIGSLRFGFIYIITGLAASSSTILWSQFMVSVGASGPIFGLYGFFLALLFTDLIEKETRKPLLASIGVFVLYNIISGFDGKTDIAAHAGGLLSGFIAGFILKNSLSEEYNDDIETKIKSPLILITGVLIFTFVVIKVAPDDLGKYEKLMKDIPTLEAMGVEPLNDYYLIRYLETGDTTIDKKQIVYSIKTRGNYYINECIKRIEAANRLKLPPIVYEKNNLILSYFYRRVEYNELILNALQEDPRPFKDRLIEKNKELEKMLKEMEKYK